MTGLLRRHRTAAISLIAGVIATVLTVGHVSLLPPHIGARQLQLAGAATSVMIDNPRSATTNRHTDDVGFASLGTRTTLIGDLMTSDPVVADVARRARIRPDQINALTQVTADVPRALTEPNDERRANDIWHSRRPYRLEVESRTEAPIVDIYTQAPTVDGAVRLADASVQAIRDHLGLLGRRQGFARSRLLRVEQLGRARGAVINGGVAMKLGVLAFLLGSAGMTGLLGLARRLRRREAERAWEPVPDNDDWPHTTRALPWMLAFMFFVLWLVPFNSIQLRASLPVDLKFDRLVLPFIALTWILALIQGGRHAPRLRLTPIHIAVGVFALAATLSVVANAAELNRLLELDAAIKQIPLLFAYLSFFVIVASTVRRTEVRAFLKLTLVFATLCAVALIYEFHFEYNIFYSWSAKLLPGVFEVATFDPTAVDDIGRRMIVGPAEVGLEAVAMLAMALPIALVGIVQARTWRNRLLYGLAACLLLAASFSTYRKSALLAPLSVFATLAYFRRRELVKMIPLAMVLLVVVHFLSPGAIGSTTIQLSSNRLGVTTVSDRTADYDAVRPDIWTHLILGRGWGSYDHRIYRVLDNEVLHRAVEMGAVGVVAFLAMGIAVILTARRAIRERHPTWAPIALACAAAAVAFLVISTLFDSMSFPHAPYIFLSLSGLLAASLPPPGRTAEDRRRGDREMRDRLAAEFPDGYEPIEEPVSSQMLPEKTSASSQYAVGPQ